VTEAGAPAPDASPDGPPAWARRLKRGQTMSHGVTLAAHAVRAGDGGGAGSSIRLAEDR
jgi:type IV secretion system protein TrbL